MDCNWLLVMTDGMGGEPKYQSIHADTPKEALEAATEFVVEEQRRTDEKSGGTPFTVTGVLFREAAEWRGKSFVGNAESAGGHLILC